MKKIFILSLLLVSFSVISAQEWAQRWSNSTASLKPKGKWESGLFQPFRIGISDKMELSTHLLMPLLPEVGLKVSYGKKGGFDLAGEHVLSYPSLFLNTFSMKGIGGLISPEYDFGTILALKNTLIASKPAWNNGVLSLKAGLAFAVCSERPDPQSAIDFELFYPRMAHYYKGVSFRPEAGIIKPIGKKLALEESARLFIITRDGNNFFAENNGTVYWAFSRVFRLKAGYILTYGTYPFGSHWHLWPTLDLVFGSKP
jgi:hypothetical protein